VSTKELSARVSYKALFYLKWKCLLESYEINPEPFKHGKSSGSTKDNERKSHMCDKAYQESIKVKEQKSAVNSMTCDKWYLRFTRSR
jgi:hypothetical protein